MHTSSVSTKGQVVIPKAVRERLGLRAGAQVQFIEEGDSLRLMVLRRKDGGATLESGFGLASYKGPRISEDDIRNAVLRRAASRG